MNSTNLALGVAADLLIGDPRWLPHPVSAIGNLARANEKLWRGWLPLRIAGACAWCCVVGITTGVVYATLRIPYAPVYWIFSFLALRSLEDHARAVVNAPDLEQARVRVGYMVGRDTAALDEPGIARALIETVAENASDGVIAPLFWLSIGGPAAMAAYKAVNTLDSMWGYRNDRYRDFGWWCARADDWANWIPARLTAALFWLVAFVWPGLNGAASVRCTFRDAGKQPSPNSGWPEAAAAGALGVQLGGVNWYRGVRSEKSTLGDALQPLQLRRDYGRLRILLFGSTAIFTAGVFLAWR